MPLPFAAALLGAGGATILDYALGRPLNIWGKYLDAQQSPRDRANVYIANQVRANVIPPPDAIIEAFRRGLIHRRIAQRFLAYQGVSFSWNDRPDRNYSPAYNSQQNAILSANYGDLWEQIGKMRRSRPEPGAIMQAWLQRRIDRDQWDRLVDGLDWDSQLYFDMAEAQFASPGWQDLWNLRQRGVIDSGQYDIWCRRLGWYDTEARVLQQKVSVLPTPRELMLARYRGALNNDEFRAYMSAQGWTDDRAVDWMVMANRPLPGPSDLVRFAVREVWDQDTVQRWGYDDEFPYPFQHWMRWYGQEWGEGFNGPDGTPYPSVPWPLAYWRAHWQIMSPQQAYRALHLLRPDRLQRYRALAPDVTEFTAQDMRTVLKVSDYPPKMRAWLAAIAFNPLRLTDIRTAFVNKIRDRAWAVNQMLDRGMVREDAETAVDLWANADQIAFNQAYKSLARSALREAISEVRQVYRMGGFTQVDARGRLVALGLPTPVADRMLAIEDARFARAELLQFVRQTRKSYLSGALSDLEAVQALQAAKIAAPAIQRYLRTWQSELGIERRSLSTAQITQAVAAGALDIATAQVRLSRLGWTVPDVALLLQQAAARLAQHQASAARSAQRQAKASAAALVAAQRQAAQVVQRTQSQLRRMTPIATLKRWLQLGIRKSSWIQARLMQIGYDTDTSDALLKEWVMEALATPPAEPPAVRDAQQLVRRQTPISTLKSWFQKGIIDEQFTRDRLAASGYTADNIDRYLAEWGASGQ